MAKDLELKIRIAAQDAASSVLGKVENSVKQVGVAIAAYFTVGAVQDFFSSAVGLAGDLQRQLSELGSVTQATADELAALQARAEELGASDTINVTAQQAAEAMTNLGRAGLSTAEILDAIGPSLALAQANATDFAAAAGQITQALAGFQLEADQAGRVADVFTRAAQSANTTVTDLSAALSYAAPAANAAGMSLEQTTAAIAKMQDAGIEGTRAGTALNTMLAQLADPASKASQALQAAGISTRDFAEVLSALEQGGPAAEQAILSFGTEAGPALRALLGQGSDALHELTEALRNSGGAAAEASAAMADNLQGAVDGLASVWDALKSSLGEALLEPLERQVRSLSAAISDFAASPAFAALKQNLVSAFEAAAAAVREFFAQIDWAGLGQQVEAFAASAKQVLDDFARNTQAVATAVSTSWNTVMAVFRAVQQSVELVAAGVSAGLDLIMRGVASTLEGLAALGLASEEVAMKTRAAQETLAQATSDLVARANQHYQEMQQHAAAAVGAVEQGAASSAVALRSVGEAATDAADGTDALTSKAGLTADELDALGTSASYSAEAQSKLVQHATAAAQAETTLAEAAASGGAAVAELAQEVDAAAAAHADSASAMEASAQATQGYAEAAQQVGGTYAEQVEQFDQIVNAHERYTSQLESAQATMQAAAGASEALANAQQLAAETQQEYADAVANGAENVDALQSAYEAAAGHVETLKEQIQAGADAEERSNELKKQLADNTLRLRDALNDTVEAIDREIAGFEREAEITRARIDLKIAEIGMRYEAAKARGDEAEATRYSTQLAQLEAAELEATATMQHQSADALKRKADVTYEAAIADGDYTEAERALVEQLRHRAEMTELAAEKTDVDTKAKERSASASRDLANAEDQAAASTAARATTDWQDGANNTTDWQGGSGTSGSSASSSQYQVGEDTRARSYTMDFADTLQREASARGLDIPVVGPEAQAAVEAFGNSFTSMLDEINYKLENGWDIDSEVDQAVAAAQRAVAELNQEHTESEHTVNVGFKVETNAMAGMLPIEVTHQSTTPVAVTAPTLSANRGGQIPYDTVPGVGNHDSVPALLPGGTFVLRKPAVQHYGRALLERVMRFAGGGLVPAVLTPGERLFAPDLVGRLGVGFFEALNRLEVPAAALHEAPQRLADGGSVGSSDSMTVNLSVGNKGPYAVRSSREQAAGLVRALRDLSRSA